MTFKVIRGQGEDQEMTSVPCRDYSLFIDHVWSDGTSVLPGSLSACCSCVANIILQFSVLVECWHGCLSGVRCKFAYGPADATVTHCLLLQ